MKLLIFILIVVGMSLGTMPVAWPLSHAQAAWCAGLGTGALCGAVMLVAANQKDKI